MISALLLAGGKGSRLDGADKGLLDCAGKPLIAHVLARLAPQADEILISANRNLDRYAAWGYPVLTDDIADAGPLAGLRQGLRAATQPLLLTAPCDVPELPADLAERLRRALETTASDIAIACDAERCHYTIALLRRDTLAALDAYLADGGRRVGAWLESLNFVRVTFDQADCFANVNTPADLAACAARLNRA